MRLRRRLERPKDGWSGRRVLGVGSCATALPANLTAARSRATNTRPLPTLKRSFSLLTPWVHFQPFNALMSSLAMSWLIAAFRSPVLARRTDRLIEQAERRIWQNIRKGLGGLGPQADGTDWLVRLKRPAHSPRLVDLASFCLDASDHRASGRRYNRVVEKREEGHAVSPAG